MLRFLFYAFPLVVWLMAPLPGFTQDYILGEGDVFTVSVYEQPDLETTVRISGDGKITLPLIGQVAAGDISIKQLAARIEALLADGYIVNPQVNIFMKEFRGRKVTILGEVKSSGVYEIKGYTTLLELISRTGGLTTDAANQAFIHRGGAEKFDKAAITIDLRGLMEEGRAAQNIPIVDGDNIYIPRKERFYLSGEVESPGAYNYEDDLTVIKALTMAGGATDKAAPNRIKIIRNPDGQEHIIKDVRMDMRVQPNDVIVVPESYF